MLPTILIVTSAAIVGTLGLLHLIITFSGPKLHPRDRDLKERMETVSPVITRQTTMWKAWIGFNASHGFGAMLFAAIYGYMAVAQSALLFRSVYLFAVGEVLLIGFVILAHKYWFTTPRRGLWVALICYTAGFVIAGA